jgi:hypothetical protein
MSVPLSGQLDGMHKISIKKGVEKGEKYLEYDNLECTV